MTGYQEILTDPSYFGQIVVMSAPMIGNYGINPEDSESKRAFAAGLVVREASPIVSNWRANKSLGEYLAFQGVPGLTGVDTRALVRHLRERGTMRGAIVALNTADEIALAKLRATPFMAGSDLASGVSTSHSYAWDAASVGISGRVAPAPVRFHVVVYDFGVKHNILRRLVDESCSVTVVPGVTSAAEVLAQKPDGVLLSNGPGDPEPLEYAVKAVRELLGKCPIFGICLGHQVLALASGGKSFKLKFGHHGGNHPVKNLSTGKVEITSHNHGFSIDPDSLDANQVEPTHISLNDQTLEGLRRLDVPAFSVQYHPEAAPGPRDAKDLFRQFVQLMEEKQGA